MIPALGAGGPEFDSRSGPLELLAIRLVVASWGLFRWLYHLPIYTPSQVVAAGDEPGWHHRIPISLASNVVVSWDECRWRHLFPVSHLGSRAIL
jgi:hypothetical protein